MLTVFCILCYYQNLINSKHIIFDTTYCLFFCFKCEKITSKPGGTAVTHRLLACTVFQIVIWGPGESLKCLFWSHKLFPFKIKVIASNSKHTCLPKQLDGSTLWKSEWQSPEDTSNTSTHTDLQFPKIYKMTIIAHKVLGEETYQLQPGICDQHLVLFILERNRSRTT